MMCKVFFQNDQQIHENIFKFAGGQNNINQNWNDNSVQFDLKFYLYDHEFWFVPTHMYMCTLIWWTEFSVGYFPQLLPPYVLRQGVSLYLKFNGLTRLTAQ